MSSVFFTSCIAKNEANHYCDILSVSYHLAVVKFCVEQLILMEVPVNVWQLFWILQISQVIVGTQLKWGGCLAQIHRKLPLGICQWKEFQKSVDICQSYDRKWSVLLFSDTVCIGHRTVNTNNSAALCLEKTRHLIFCHNFGRRFQLLPLIPGTVCLSMSPWHPLYESSEHVWRFFSLSLCCAVIPVIWTLVHCSYGESFVMLLLFMIYACSRSNYIDANW